MKKIILSFFGIMFGLTVLGQTTISIKLNAGDEDASIDDYAPAQNNPNEIEYYSGAWTIGGTQVIWRNLFKFDFSAIPSNAVIQNAHLNLYFAPLNNFFATDTSLTNSNESVLQRVTGQWSENSVNWNNQPTTTSQNEVVYPASISPTQDYLMTDVTALVLDILNSGSNDGFMLHLQSESPYACLIFASGDYPDQALHPELVITYTLCSTVLLDDNGEDATIDTYTPGNNYPNEIELTSNAWTIGGVPVTWRSLMKFDLSSIPANAIISSAHLSLYYADTNNFVNSPHSSLTSSNESVIMRVVDPWSENQVTWNNQPSATSQNQVILNQTVTGFEDFVGLDVTGQVQDMMSAPNGNQGFLLRLTNETHYARMFFASGDNPHVDKRPSLEVCYTIPTGIQNLPTDVSEFLIYPNPSNGEFTIIADRLNAIQVYNSIGELVFEKHQIESYSKTFNVDLNHPGAGIYFARILAGEKWFVQKVVIK